MAHKSRFTEMKYQELATKFIEKLREDVNFTIREKERIEDFARFLDDQENKEPKPRKKIEKLKEIEHPEQGNWPFGDSLISILNEERDTINQLIEDRNSEE